MSSEVIFAIFSLFELSHRTEVGLIGNRGLRQRKASIRYSIAPNLCIILLGICKAGAKLIPYVYLNSNVETARLAISQTRGIICLTNLLNAQIALNSSGCDL